jgi:ornithine cyclodeaminase/alanine dehydrogenase-like protein (mu-crystallin family)
MLYLDKTAVRKALPMASAVDAMKRAFKSLTDGDAVVPVRTVITVPEHEGDLLFMPSHSPAEGHAAVKVVTLFKGNRAKGIPFIQAMVLVFDATDGSPVGILDGTILTALRTGAASGAATDVLARPDARSVAIFGAGVQARTQLEAVCAVRSIEEARVCDVDADCATRYASEMTEALGIPVRACRSSREALDGADVVCAATTSATPVFADDEVAPGTHINAVGSYKPEVREVPGATVVRARVFVDQLEAAWEEAGDLIIPVNEGLIERDHVAGTIGEALAGTLPGRTDAEQVTFFKSVGIAIQDLAAARTAIENAKGAGLGTSLG